VVRGLVSLLAIGVFVAGPPVAAVVTAGWWRQYVPRRGQVWHFLTTSDDSLDVRPALAGLLVVVLVAVWAVLAGLLVRDLVAALTRRGPVRRRVWLPAPLHTLVTAAAGAAAVTVTTGAAHATVPPPSAGIVATQPAAPTPPGVLPAASTVSTAAPVYQVREGDWLWHVADRFLGDPLRYPDITVLNADHRRQHAGFPDHIEPGWRLRLPSDARDRGPRRHATGALAAPPEAKPPAPPPPTPPPAVPHPSPGITANATAAPTSSSPASTTPGDRDEGEYGVGLGRYGWVTAPVATAIAAAAALVWLRRRRYYQPRPPTGVRRTDPDLIAPAPAIAAIPASTRPSAADEAGTVGVDGSRLLALDELPAGGVGLTGPGTPDAARGLLVATLAAGGEDATVLTTTGDLDTLLPAGQGLRPLQALRVVDTLTDALTVLEQELLRRSRTIAETTDDGTGEQDLTPPPLLLLTGAPEATAGTRLAAILAVGSRLGIHAVLLGTWPSGPTWHVDTDGTVRSNDQAPATQARLNTLTADAAVDVLDTLALAGIAEDDTTQPPPPSTPAAAAAESAEPETPEAVAPAEPAAGERPDTVGRLRLTLLGPPAVAVTDHSGQSHEVYIRRSDSLHILYYLAVEPRGGTIDEIMEALYPEERRTPARRKFHTSASELRHTLRDQVGADLILKTNNRYRLDRRHVEVDLWHLHAAIDAAANAVDPDTQQQHLRKVVEAYTGPLADGDDRHWLTVPREALRRNIIDAYTRLADQPTDPGAALNLIQDAIHVDPYNELLYRRAIILHGTLGNIDGIQTALRTLAERLRELRAPMTQRTRQLAAEQIAAVENRH
jgi:DNA-binding SARP family transcriptional activator